MCHSNQCHRHPAFNQLHIVLRQAGSFVAFRTRIPTCLKSNPRDRKLSKAKNLPTKISTQRRRTGAQASYSNFVPRNTAVSFTRSSKRNCSGLCINMRTSSSVLSAVDSKEFKYERNCSKLVNFARSFSHCRRGGCGTGCTGLTRSRDDTRLTTVCVSGARDGRLEALV
jgi:hypothetical protein